MGYSYMNCLCSVTLAPLLVQWYWFQVYTNKALARHYDSVTPSYAGVCFSDLVANLSSRNLGLELFP